MIITFLVGNGFDIEHGIKSSYRDFYEWYCKQPSNNDHISKFKEAILSGLSDDSDTWSDFEIGLGKYTVSFSLESADIYQQCYDDAYASIRKYLSEQEAQECCKLVTDKDIDSFRQGIGDFYLDLPSKPRQKISNLIESLDKGGSTVAFISFNYTSLLDNIVKRCSSKPIIMRKDGNIERTWNVSESVIHPHGTLQERFICGVNDTTQIENKDLLKAPLFEDWMIKNNAVEKLGCDWYDNACSFINQSKFICIWGMSLGESDKFWWNYIYKWLANDGAKQLFLFWYSPTPPDPHFSRTMIFEYEEIKKKFFAYSGFSDDITRAFSDRVHVIFNTKRVFCKTSRETASKEELVTIV